MATESTFSRTATLLQHRNNLSPARLGALTGGCLAVALVGYSGSIERRWLAVTQQQVVLPNLPTAWDGLRLVHLSDFHLRARGTPEPMLRRTIATTLALHPDLILLTGDYSDDGKPRDLDLLRPLAHRAPTFAILGNHDYFEGTASADRIASILNDYGITVLRNTLTTFVHNGVAGTIVGFDQSRGHGSNAVKRLLLQVAEHRPQIALIHEPDLIEQFPACSVGVTLAGHTHGAQIRLSPVRRIDWIRWSPTDNNSHYPRGWFLVNETRLYVSRGLGVSWLPVRFAARPELVSLTLRARIPMHEWPRQETIAHGRQRALVDRLVV